MYRRSKTRYFVVFHVDPWVQQHQLKLCWGHPLQAAHLVRPGGLGEGAGLGDGHDACGLDGGVGSRYPQTGWQGCPGHMSGLVQLVLAGDQGAHTCGLEGGVGSGYPQTELCRVLVVGHGC